MLKLNITKKEKYYGLLILFISASQLLPALIYSFTGNEMPRYLLFENGIYETGAAIFCLLAGIVFLYSFLKFPKQIDYFLFSSNKNTTVLLFSILLFLLFAEEISWGQYMLGFKIPEIMSKINFQNEINLHNLKIIQNKNNELSDVLFFLLLAYLLVLPLFAYSFPFVKKIAEHLGVPIASLQIALCVFIIREINHLNYWLFYQDISPIKDHYRIGEAFESNIEILLFVLSLEYLYLCRSSQFTTEMSEKKF